LAGYGLRGAAIALVATAVASMSYVAPLSSIVPTIMVATAAVSVET
jgi:hypothetical protein